MTISWRVAPCLLVLREEFNELNPGRDKGADGTIGDAAHQSHASDHDPDAAGWVKALDVDSSGPWPGTIFHTLVMFIVNRCRSGAEKRIRYIIHDRVLYHERDGFKGVPYTGADPHTNHAHFSSDYDEAVFTKTQPWLIAAEFGDDMPTPAEYAKAVWEYQLGSPYVLDKDGNQVLKPAADYQRYTPSASWHQTTQGMIATLTATLAAFIASETTDDASKAAALKAIRDGITALAPSVAATVVAALPKGSDAITQEEVTKAVESAFSKAFGSGSVLSS